ncbi:MAG: mechanosensitive ion channel family protein [Halioglobus sp.]|nr:mechanosensitive ion channel family protein [Halioglobus sp.]
MQKLLGTMNASLEFLGDHVYLKALFVLLIAFTLARLISFLLSRLLGGLVKHGFHHLHESITRLLRAPLYWTVIAVGFLLALELAGPPAQLLVALRAIILSLLLIAWSTFAVRLTRVIMQNMSSRHGAGHVIRQHTLPLFNNIALVTVISIAVYLLFHIWSIDMTAWLASAGIVGIAVGFAAKDTLANLFAGAFILADAPYKIGDYIVLENTQRGKVTNIGLRSTRILTRDDVEVTVPNSVIGNSSVINESGGPHVKYRVRVPIGVAYGSDIDLVRKVLMDIAEANDQVCREPEHRVRFRNFGPSALEFELLCWIEDPELRGRAVDALNCAIYQKFIDNHIEIPYAKRDVYIKGWPEGANGRPADPPDQPG